MQRRTAGRGLAAVLFTDIVGSTSIAAEMGNTRWVELVARHHRIVRHQVGRFGGREVDDAGDGFFITFERPADAIRCAVAAAEAVRELGIEIRAGVSFGELETVGRKPGGLAVNTASRVMSVGGPGEVLVPASVREIVSGSGITFAEHGVHRLKGLEGEFRLSSVTGVDGAEVPPPLEGEKAAARRRDIFPSGARRRPAMLVGIAAGLVALITAGVLFATGREPAGPRTTGITGDSVAPFATETGRLGTRIALGAEGRDATFLAYVDQPIAAGEGSVWVLRAPRLINVDPHHDEIRSTVFDIGFANSQTVETGADSVWVLSASTLYKVHPGTAEATRFLVLPPPPGIVTWSFALDDAIWVAESDGTLVRMDPRTGARDQSETGLRIDLLGTTGRRLWASDVIEGELREIDRSTLMPTGRPLRIGGSIDGLVGRGDRLWVLDRQLGVVTRVDVASRAVSRSVRVGDDPSGIAVGEDAVWVGDVGGSLYRVDVSTLEVDRISVGFEVLGVDVDVASGEVWLYLGAAVAPP
jgi:class 3 adenylate cyclase